MKIQSLFMVSIICFFCIGAFAESGSTATGLCKDGTSYTGASKRGACRGHKGVKEWYGDNTATATSSPASSVPATTVASDSGVATGMCKDGTPYTGASKKGACRGHKGIKEWYADKNSVSAPAAVPATTAVTPAATADGAATGLCKDGTPYTGASKRGACRGHKGIKEWYADKQVPTASEATPATAAPVAATPAADGGAAATGLCKDGTTYTGASKRGACRGHKGVKEWYADKQPAPAAESTAPAATVAPAATAAPVKAAATAPAAGSGKVWVNTRSKIYHCEGSKFYGKTKEGEYMNEADAQAQGYNANRKKVCH
ncbi:hypothetical protein [Methyloglobulus sp.]|uniref:hypothetical protein n=1 Tax=Methyloglobulus sp. TaxID=2518622 RepID=UPI0032B7BDC4